MMAEEEDDPSLSQGLDISSFTMSGNENFNDINVTSETQRANMVTEESSAADAEKQENVEDQPKISRDVEEREDVVHNETIELSHLPDEQEREVEETLTFNGEELSNPNAQVEESEQIRLDVKSEIAVLAAEAVDGEVDDDEDDDEEEAVLATPNRRVLKKRLIDIECPQCDQTFISQSLLRQHRKTHAKPKAKKRKKKSIRFGYTHPIIDVNCETCGKHFKRSDHYKRHMLTHERQRLKTEAKALQASGDAEGASKLLEICSISNTSRNLRRIVDVSCSECGRRFTRTDHLKRHQKANVCQRAKKMVEPADGDNPKSSNPSTKTGPNKSPKSPRKLVDVFCKTCGKYFNRVDHLRRHEAVHMIDRPFKCTICPLSFTRQERLAKHVPKHNFPCDQCSKFFSKAELLEKHKLGHLFKCEFCNTRFDTKETLKDHLPIHEHEMPNICDICGKRFHFKKQLHNHREVHKADSPNYTPFTCEVCGQLCKTKKLLHRHQVGHTGRRDFMCTICGKSFKVRVDLTKHNIIHYGSRKHKCAICDKGFYQNKDLKRHMQVHGDATPFKCEICHKGFKVRYNYNMHMFTHSGKHPFECQICLVHFRSGVKLKMHIMDTHPEAKHLLAKLSDTPTPHIDANSKVLAVPQSGINHVPKQHLPTPSAESLRHVNESPAAMGMDTDSCQSIPYQPDAIYNQHFLSRMLIDPDPALYGGSYQHPAAAFAQHPTHNGLEHRQMMYGNMYEDTAMHTSTVAATAQQMAPPVPQQQQQQENKVLTEREQESVVYSHLLWDWTNLKESQDKWKQAGYPVHRNTHSKLDVIESISPPHDTGFDWDDSFDTPSVAVTMTKIKQENTENDDYKTLSSLTTTPPSAKKKNNPPDDDLETIMMTVAREAGTNTKCPICDRVLSRLDHLKTHVRNVHSKRLIIDRGDKKPEMIKYSDNNRTCDICDREFRRADHLRRHLRLVHKKEIPLRRRQATATSHIDPSKLKDVMENDYFVLMTADGDDDNEAIDINSSINSGVDYNTDSVNNDSFVSDSQAGGKENENTPVFPTKVELMSEVDETDVNHETGSGIAPEVTDDVCGAVEAATTSLETVGPEVNAVASSIASGSAIYDAGTVINDSDVKPTDSDIISSELAEADNSTPKITANENNTSNPVEISAEYSTIEGAPPSPVGAAQADSLLPADSLTPEVTPAAESSPTEIAPVEVAHAESSLSEVALAAEGAPIEVAPVEPTVDEETAATADISYGVEDMPQLEPLDPDTKTEMVPPSDDAACVSAEMSISGAAESVTEAVPHTETTITGVTKTEVDTMSDVEADTDMLSHGDESEGDNEFDDDDNDEEVEEKKILENGSELNGDESMEVGEEDDYNADTDTEESPYKSEKGAENTEELLKSLSQSKTTCPICGKKYSRPDHVRRHIRKIHKVDIASPRKPVAVEVKLKRMILRVKSDARRGHMKCPVCDKELTRMRVLVQHCERVHHMAITVDKSTASPEKRSPGQVTQKAVVREKIHQCVICEKIFKRKDHLNRHSLVHSGSKPFQCDRCSMAFTRKEYLENHIQTHSPKCEICNVEFDGKIEYKQHLIEFHEHDKPNICELCGERFLLKMQLKNHIKTHNPDTTSTKTYTCEICGQVFRQKRLLERHHVGHSGRRDFICQICGKAFKMKVDLYKHSVYHSEKKNYQCPKCPLAFFQSKDLRRHLFNHSDIKPHKCDVCDRAFKNKQNLKVHAYTHTGTKPHQCQFCLLSFRSGVKLEAHQAANHAGHEAWGSDDVTRTTSAALEQQQLSPGSGQTIRVLNDVAPRHVKSEMPGLEPLQTARGLQQQSFDETAARMLQGYKTMTSSAAVTPVAMVTQQQVMTAQQLQYDCNQPLQLTSEANPRYIMTSQSLVENQSAAVTPMLASIEAITPVASPQPSGGYQQQESARALSAHELVQRAFNYNPAHLNPGMDALHRALRDGIDYTAPQAHTNHGHNRSSSAHRIAAHSHGVQRALTANQSQYNATPPPPPRVDQSRLSQLNTVTAAVGGHLAHAAASHAVFTANTHAQYPETLLTQEQTRWIFSDTQGFQQK